MNARQITPRVVVVLVLLGALCMNMRVMFRQKKQLVPGDSFWSLTYTLNFQAKKAGARVHAAFPDDTAHGRITQQKAPAGEIDLDRRRTKSETREVGLTALRPGPVVQTAQFDIHLSPRATWRTSTAPVTLTAERRAAYLRSEKGIQVDDPKVAEVLERVRSDPATRLELLDKLFAYCGQEIGSGGRKAPGDAASALRQGVASAQGKTRAFVALCRAAKLPTRLVTGFEIKQGNDIHPHFWAEVLTGEHWEPYDPENGFSRELPHNFLPVRRDGAAIVRASDVSDLRSTFRIVRVAPPAEFRSESPRPTDILDLTRLPVEMQKAFVVILLMPLGGLLTTIFRTIIGIRTFGTFTPTLLALAFVYNDWHTGLLIFAVVLVLGLASRSLLEQLKLLLVPRLSIILTLVVLCMVFTISVLDYYDFTPSRDAVLLPMVILTMTVERFYLTSEEDSPAFAGQLLLSTLLVGACCYLILRWETVGRFFLIYPETHLLTIALLVLLGRYAGYRLTELWRFRDLAEPHSYDPPMFDLPKRLWNLPGKLHRQGILGINARNSQYLLPTNARAYYPRVDDKMLTKKICHAHGIPVPKTYAVIERYGDVRRLAELLAGHPDFVVKPGEGSEGRGIVVVTEHAQDEFVTAGAQRLTLADLRYHVSTILAGLYSLGGQPDRAIVEQRIVRHAVFQHVAVDGTPDVRIILYRCVPVMAMVRLPTRESRGRANLHQGAVAAGIELRSGRTLGGVCRNRTVSVHPDTGAPIAGIQVPMWDRLLDAAIRLAVALELGYVGVDFVLDAELGPVILEANARPGLAIQVANRLGLRRRLDLIDAQAPERLVGPARMELIAQLAEIV